MWGAGQQIKLKVVGVGGGETTLIATWNVWGAVATDYGGSWHLVQGYYFYNNDPTTVDVVEVEITRNDEFITNKTSTVIVGQHIVLHCVVIAPGRFDTSDRSWMVSGNPIKNYVQTTGCGYVVDLEAADLQSNELAYYWIAGGKGLPVTCMVTVAGRLFTAQAKFDVLRPTPAALTSTLTILNPAVDFRTNGGAARLQFGNYGNFSDYGITWSANANPPSGGDGEIGLTQLVSTDRRRTLTQGGTKQKRVSEGYVLDGHNGIQYGGSQPVTHWEGIPPLPLERVDAPYVSVDDTISRVSVDETFQLYLMYKPSGNDSIWVTLRELDWFWGGSMHSEGGSPVIDSRKSPPQAPSSVDSTKLPEWDGNFDGLQWANE